MASPVHRLSEDELAACFAFLDLVHLIQASHVCQIWRSAALAFPALWTHISIQIRLAHPTNILHMAMSRSGCLAVDFEVRGGFLKIPEGLADAVSLYMDRFRVLKWVHDPATLDLTRPAPLLRDFACKWLCVIPRDFLGGVAGNLRTMRIASAVFPETCPALKAVTYLDMAFPWIKQPDEITQFSQIFHLFPQLEVLHLHNLEGSPGSKLPVGPAPRSLQEVSLQGCASCNLFQLYTAWELESVTTVLIEKDVDAWFDIKPFIYGALELAVEYHRGSRPRVHTIALLSHGRRRTFVWYNLPESRRVVDEIADAIQDAPALAHMHTLNIPLSILRAALAGAYHWPSLTRLTAHFHDYEHEIDNLRFYGCMDDPLRFRWRLLDCFRAAPALEALTLHIHTWDDATPPTLQEARKLTAHLVTLRDHVPRDVLVHGFPMEAVRALSRQDDTGPQVVFLSEN